MKLSPWASLVLASVAVFGCEGPAGQPGMDASVQPPRVVLGDGELLLDVRGGLTLAARLVPVVPRSDADRVLSLRLEGDGALEEALDGVDVLDARIAGAGVVVIDTDGTLRWVGPDGRATPLDEQAHGPLSVAGELVAYVRGAPPDLELARANVRSGQVEVLTRAMAPVWSPALSDEGGEVIFVSGASGTPRLHRLRADGDLDALAPSERFPTAPSTPRWRGSTLVFEDAEGIAWLDLERGVVVDEVPGARALAALGDGTLIGSRGDGQRALEPLGGTR